LNATELEELDVIIDVVPESVQKIPSKTLVRPSIQVIGLGTVGVVHARVLENLGCDVYGYDPFLKETPANCVTFSANAPFLDCSITFICTMECQVEDAVRKLAASGYEGLIVIKSSVVPKTTETLMAKYGVHICHNPEFIRERTALRDASRPDFVVIGQCCEEHGQQLRTLYKPLNSRIIMVDPTTSETAKLHVNAYLALMISYWNQVHLLAQKLGISSADLAEIVTADKRISKHGTKWFGESFDGKCLPKDLVHLIGAYRAEGINPIILEAVREVNDACKRMK
jgi:UDP-glucose 6-dehydrogenase